MLMLQDSGMESKCWPSNGTTNPESRSGKSEVCGVVNKPSRNGKKRENAVQWSASSGSSGAAGLRNQKSSPNQIKECEKRQKGKSGYGGSHRKNDHKMTDSCDPDLDSILPETGKKQNLAHLLNMKFQFSPRDSHMSSYWHATHSSGSTSKSKHFNKHMYHGRNHLNKDQYLQANCQFVVKADEDYSVYLADPDLLVKWESIEQIRIWGSEAETANCPICLHPPVAARMTRCGHIYCWPCILHFLALSDKSSRPCPICDAAVRIPDLRSVITLEQQQVKVGDEIEMTLMKRDRHSLCPQPVSGFGCNIVNTDLTKPMRLKHSNEDSVFSKLLLCTPRDVVDLILQYEKLQLQKQWEEEKECPESCFIQQALDLLASREAAILETFPLQESTLDAGSRDENAGTKARAAEFLTEVNKSSEENALKFDQSCSAEDILSNTFTASVLAPMHTSHPQQHKNVFYFYQASDGQAIYLHPINVQMLVHCYGSLESSPHTIIGRVVEMETFSMTEELRNRLRYLGHVPISKQFQIMEITLSDATISSSVMKEFKHRVDDRERRRRRKEIEEFRRSRDIQRAEDAKWGRNMKQPIVHLDSQVHFPGFSSTDHDPVLSYEDQASFLNQSSYSELEFLGPKEENSGLSFAQMLREGKNKVPVVWPSLSDKEKVVSVIKLNNSRIRGDSGSICDEFSPVPDYKETFNSTLAAAFDQAAKSTDFVDSQSMQKKGKKKNKQKLLFSTGMNFL